MLTNSWSETKSPVEEFSDFKYVSWEQEIYPKYKGAIKQEEVDFLCSIITSNHLKSVIDFAVGGGLELSNILDTLKHKNYILDAVEGNEVDEAFIGQANLSFLKKDY